MKSPRLETTLRGIERRGARRAAALRTPRARAQRKRSRTAYKSLRGQATLRLARRSFRDVFREPVWRGLKPGHGQRVRGYRDDYTAELEDADGTESIATSTLPLRTRDRGGRAVPVDLGIEAAGDAYAPRSPLVPTRISKRAGGGVTLGREAIGVRPLGAADVTGTFEDDRLFYPDTGTDTDLLIEPHDTGAELMWQVRSAASPERHSLALDLPAGARLRSSARVPGAAEISRGGKLLALVQPPTAVDADGTSVPATYAISGSTLTVAVPHREASIRYPLLVDPEFNVIEDFFNADWTTRTDDGGFGWTPGINGDWNWTANSWALHVSGKPWVGYVAGQWANWHWYAPRNSYIYRADFLNMTYQAKPSSATANSCPHFGIIAADWERVAGVSNCAVDYPSLALPGLCVDNPDCSPSAGTDGNRAVSGLDTRVAGGGNSAFLSLGRAVLYLRDRHRPRVLSTSHSTTLNNALADGRWLGPGVNLASTPRGADWGLGIARFDLINRVSERRIPVFGSEGNPRNLWCAFSSPAHDLTPGPNGEPIDPGSDKGDRQHRCIAAQTNPGVTPPDNQTVASTFDYSTDQLDEGVHAYGVDAYDIVGTKTDPPTSGWTLKVDRKAPDLALAGALWDQRSQNGSHLDVSAGQDLYQLRFTARDGVLNGPPADRRSGVKDLAVFIDGIEEDRFTTDPATCPDSCELAGEFSFDADWVTEGAHTVKVVTRDRLDQATETSFTVRVVRDDHYATQLDAWRRDTEQRADAALPVVALTRPLPVPPDDWRRGGDCESAEVALRGCYDRVSAWGNDLRAWISENLPGGVATTELPDPPTFEYSYAEDTSRVLTRRIRDEFVLAKRTAGNPTGTLDVVITFHRPLDPAQFAAAVPITLPQQRSALAGIYDPGGADWQGQVRIPIASTLSTSVEDFYSNQSAAAAETIAEVNADQADDADDAEDRAAAIAEASAFKQHLDGRLPFITGTAVRLDLVALRAILTDATDVIKAVRVLPADTNLAAAGADALGAAAGPDAATVRHVQSITDGGGAGASAFSAISPSALATAAATPREQTCVQRGQRGFLKRALLDPHPQYWAPSRHKADTAEGKADGEHHMKKHNLEFRWKKDGGLAWMCSDRPGDRNVEIEARVYPEFPDEDDNRWSDNWESNSARKYTTTNVPGNIHQDDLANGNKGRYLDKQYYPDFAIVAQSSQAFRYRKLYFTRFTTNEGQTDDSQEVVIYSGQATSRARDEDGPFDESDYCDVRGQDYKSCMFSRVTTCWNHSTIGANAKHRTVDWLSDGMSIPPTHQSVSRWPTSAPVQDGDIVKFCDPRPPGQDRT